MSYPPTAEEARKMMPKPENLISGETREVLLGYASRRIDAAVAAGKSQVQLNDGGFTGNWSKEIASMFDATLGALGYSIERIPNALGGEKPDFLFIVRW